MQRTLTATLALTLLTAVGCGPGARQAQTMNSMKQLCLVRIEAITMDTPVPSLQKAGKTLGIDVTLIESTKHWANPAAPSNCIVLQERVPIGGKRIVAWADGRVIKEKR